MLYLIIPKSEYFNDDTQEFIDIGPWTLQLEHSLVSISKWEAKWHKAFLGKQEKTNEEMLDYIRCMTINNVSNDAYSYLMTDHYQQINDYIANPMTATTITASKDSPFSREVVTSELIYYWMVSLQIPFECQKWHLNRLLTLIKVCNVKNAPPKKMSKKSLYSRNAALNAARKQALGTTG